MTIRLPMLPGLAVLAMALAMSLPVITPGHAGDTPINLCDYSGPDYESLVTDLQGRFKSGSKAIDLRNAFKATDGYEINNKPLKARLLNVIGSLEEQNFRIDETNPYSDTAALITGGFVTCPRKGGLVDHWQLLIHEDSSGRIIEFELALFYADEASSGPRNEALKGERFNGINQSQLPTIRNRSGSLNNKASLLFAEMEDGGFLREEIAGPKDAAYEARRKKFKQNARPNLVRTYMIPMGTPIKKSDRASLHLRLGAYMTSNSWPIIVIEYDDDTDTVVSIEAIQSF